MRILMLSDVYFPRVNGVSTSIETFRRCLPTQGISVDLVAPRYGDEADTPGITRVPGWRLPFDPEDRLIRWPLLSRWLAKEAGNYDLIHIQTPFAAHYCGLAAARRAGVPVIATYHTLFEEYLQHYAPFLPAGWLRHQARQLSRRQCNALDALIVPSTAMRDRLGDYGVSCPMQVLPTGIPLGQFRHADGAAFRLRHGIVSTRPVALFVGRVAHEKNIGFLLEAVSHARYQRPDLLLLIAGEGPAVPALKAQVRALRLEQQVQFIGYLDRARELPGCYAAADAFVFASRTETQGLVLLEAMASGTPVVGLSAMGTADILDPGQGCLTPPDNTQLFGDALADLLSRPPLLARLSGEAVQHAEGWSDHATAARLARLYRQIAGNHSGARAA